MEKNEIEKAKLELAKLVLVENDLRIGAGLQPITDTIINLAKQIVKASEGESEVVEAASEFKEEIFDANPYLIEWPESTNIERTFYNHAERVLEVTFRGNSKKYAYMDFLPDKWNKIKALKENAGSIGKFINSEVKGIHTSQVI